MNERKAFPKLSFFSETILEKFQTQIDNVQALIQADRITFKQGHEKLHDGKSDLQDIYYYGQCQIEAAQTAIINLRKNGRFQDKQIEAGNLLSLASRRAVVSMRTAIRDYESGELTKRQLRRAKRLMMDCINNDVASINQEMSDTIRSAKVKPKQEEPDWKAGATDMLISKIHPAHE